jgi:hypothetical protein
LAAFLFCENLIAITYSKLVRKINPKQTKTKLSMDLRYVTRGKLLFTLASIYTIVRTVVIPRPVLAGTALWSIQKPIQDSTVMQMHGT